MTKGCKEFNTSFILQAPIHLDKNHPIAIEPSTLYNRTRGNTFTEQEKRKRATMATEHPSNKTDYFIDAESATETARLIDQDHFLTEAMGGLFSERSDIATMHFILDLGCGPGGWVRDVAFTYPQIEVTGIDISDAMMAYARSFAKVQGLNNAFFEVMDISKPLDFPDNSFDLVNARLIAFLTQEKWAQLLQECMRITRPGGVIRLTECEAITTSPATEMLFTKFTSAMRKVGQSFSPVRPLLGSTLVLSRFLRAAGYTNVQHVAHVVDFSVNTEAYNPFRHVTYALFAGMEPFLVGVGETTHEEMQQLLQQMQLEVLQDDFCALMYLLTAWGEKPQRT